jgi:predicted enzyme related to lactoylglutathione lyase
MATKSRFFWHDLMAPDIERAKAFYGEVFGWGFKTETGENPYTHIMLGDQGVGGMMKQDPAHGAPPHWLGYIDVDDIDATMATASKHGGKVLMPKMDVPEVGSFAVVADPTGGAHSPMKYVGKDAGKPESLEPPGIGHFCWDELMTPDPDAAIKYYTSVFGWERESMEMPGFGTYTLLKRPGVKDKAGNQRNAGGVMKMPPGMPPHAFWVCYIAVANAEQTGEKIKKNGGQQMTPFMDIPDVGRFAPCMDSQQAGFAILQPLPR